MTKLIKHTTSSSLDTIANEIAQAELMNEFPPVEQWSPKQVGDIDIFIDSQGRWFHEKQQIMREKLIRLFASILVFELGEYYLKTPVERLKITVEDAPFIITQWHWVEGEFGRQLNVHTNINSQVLLSQQTQIVNKNDQIYIRVHRNLLAKLSRNVYYQWIDMAEESLTSQGCKLILQSNGQQLVIASIT